MWQIKRLFLVTFCFFSCVLASWAQQVMYEGEDSGVIILSVSEFNVKKKNAVPQAIQDAYFQILFRGIPGSKEYERPLLGTDESVMNANREYYDTMIKGGRIYSFVNYSALRYYKRKEAVVEVWLNVRALELDLERNNLYRRLGLY